MKTNLSLYIHIPFCVRKCIYCDFLSFPSDEETKDRYVDRLLTEIADKGEEFEGCNVISVYIGGGTPSSLRSGMIRRIMEMVNKAYDLTDDAEITIEINPGTVDEEKLNEYKSAGINRLSIGLQSALDKELAMIGRIHTYSDLVNTFEMARKAGFDNIGVDLISALPGQTVEDYQKSLEAVIGLKPEHISAYSLQLEEGTYLYEHQDEYSFPDEDTDRQMYELTGEMLAEAGYHRYEISNYSRPGYESRHNSVYWTRGNYLGLGLGAASLIDNVRLLNTDSMLIYMKGIDTVDRQMINRKEQMEEFMFLGLRLVEGVDPDSFKSEFGLDIKEVFNKSIDKLYREKLIELGPKIRLTAKGLDVSNYVFEQFLLD